MNYPIIFSNSYSSLPDNFFQKINPTPVNNPTLIKLNKSLAVELFGDDFLNLEEKELAAYFSGNKIISGSEPIASAYAGHQFANFVPILGDGRAILLGEIIDQSGSRRDLQLKGSGPTQYSRRGDGRSALGPVLREYIVSEAMHHLGIPSTRALAAVSTGEQVYRDYKEVPGAILTRVAASHIRIGSFELFYNQNDFNSLKILADYSINRHYPELKNTENPYIAFLEAVCNAQASLIAKWMSVGFVHGVMNTDNMSISGESIDFGPCAFLESYDPNAVFSSIDAYGRYSYGNQAAVAQWNLARLAECLLPLISDNQELAINLAGDVISSFAESYNNYLLKAMSAKLAILNYQSTDNLLIQDYLKILHNDKIDFTLGFRKLSELVNSKVVLDLENINIDFKSREALEDWLKIWRERLVAENISEQDIVDRIKRTNPLYIPRNHLIEQIIQAAINEEDFTKFHRLNEILTNPWQLQIDQSIDLRPAKEHELVLKTYCGT